MPRSKRDKKISLTKIKRKDMTWKTQIVDDIRNCVETYANIFVFSVKNMRNNLLKDLRQEMKRHTRFFFGKNRLMQIALGRTKEEEIKEDIHKLSNRIKGQCGILFTNKLKDELIDKIKNYSALEYARSGFIATETITLNEDSLTDFSHAIEPHLRSLGLPTKLEKGIIKLYKEYTVCEKGKMLTPEQARILKLIEKPMAKFKLTLEACWIKDSGYESLNADSNDDDSDGENALEDVNMVDSENENE